MNTSTETRVLLELLKRQGWRLASESAVAGLWTRTTGGQAFEMYVPHELHRGSFEWSGVVNRMASALDTSPASIERACELGEFDVTKFRVGDESVLGHTVSLEAGATVVSSAFSMLRAAATTARRPKRHIQGGYSKLGDAVAQRARLGHTEEGSFVFPVLMRLDEAPEPTQTPLEHTEHVRPESEQRRVVRTLAQSLHAYKTTIIDPGVAPRQVDLLPLIVAGGSRELVFSIERIMNEATVGAFETNFDWALTETKPENAPESVKIPAEARDLVTETVRMLATPQKQEVSFITGPIIDIGHVPGDAFGDIVIQTASAVGERVGRVGMRVREADLSQLHHWMDTATTVAVQGTIERNRGRMAHLRETASPRPLGDTLFDTD